MLTATNRAEVRICMRSYSKAILPQLRCHEVHIASLLAWAKSMPNMRLASAFQSFKSYGMTSEFHQAVEVVGAFAMAIEYYIERQRDGLGFATIISTRTAVQKRVLLLPRAADLIDMTASEIRLYESCRLTLHIFAMAVVKPLPNMHKALHVLVLYLKACLERFGVDNYGAKSAKLLLWMLMIGGIAASDMIAERRWFASRLGTVVKSMDISWAETRDILEDYLWLESAFGPGGRQLWDETGKISE